MSEDLIKSVEELTTGRRRSGIQLLEYILGVLKQASPIYLNVQNKGVLMAGDVSSTATRYEGRLDLRRLDKQERILKVLERFTSEFETLALPLNVTIREYVLFLATCLKLARKLNDGQKKSLIFAETLARLNKMFVIHPVVYTKRAINDPLELLFLVTEFTIEASKSLEFPYELDDITKSQFVTLVAKYCSDSENPLLDLNKGLSEIPKFRLTISIGQDHKKIVGDILQHCFPKIPLQIRVDAARKLLDKIVSEENDSIVLNHYNTLKLVLTEDEGIIGQVQKFVNAEIAKKRHNRFVDGILHELSIMRSKI